MKNILKVIVILLLLSQMSCLRKEDINNAKNLKEYIENINSDRKITVENITTSLIESYYYYDIEKVKETINSNINKSDIVMIYIKDHDNSSLLGKANVDNEIVNLTYENYLDNESNFNKDEYDVIEVKTFDNDFAYLNNTVFIKLVFKKIVI